MHRFAFSKAFQSDNERVQGRSIEKIHATSGAQSSTKATAMKVLFSSEQQKDESSPFECFHLFQLGMIKIKHWNDNTLTVRVNDNSVQPWTNSRLRLIIQVQIAVESVFFAVGIKPWFPVQKSRLLSDWLRLHQPSGQHEYEKNKLPLAFAATAVHFEN